MKKLTREEFSSLIHGKIIGSDTIEERIKTLPLWAQRHMVQLSERVKTAEATIKWTEPGMEWFTIMHPTTRVKGDDRHVKLFILNEDHAHCVCSIGPLDTVFVGRGKVNL